MANPQTAAIRQPQKMEKEPLDVVAAKSVELALVTWIDATGREVTQLAIIGDNNVHLLEGRSMGFGAFSTLQGTASKDLTRNIFKALGKKEPKAK
jgi:hypothetical protein